MRSSASRPMKHLPPRPAEHAHTALASATRDDYPCAALPARALARAPAAGRPAPRSRRGTAVLPQHHEGEMTAAPATPDSVSTQDREVASDGDLRAIMRDGISFSVMVGLGESFIAAFALAAGLGEVVAGLITTLPMLAGACLQLITPMGVRRLGSYRSWVVLCARMQALSFLPLVAAAIVGEVRLVWLAVAMVSYWTFGMSTAPAWNAWVTSLVPQSVRAGFFARRARASHVALLLALLAGGAVLELASGRGDPLLVFALLFSCAAAARLISAHYLAAQSEAPGLARAHAAIRPIGVLPRLRATGAASVLTYLLVMQVATYVAAPYFTPYMLGPLALSYGEFTWLTAASFLARIAALPLFGRLANRSGIRELLWIGAVGIVPLPLLWTLSGDFVYLLVIQLLAGFVWGALELATTLAFFERIDDEDRAGVLSVFNLMNAVALALGALIGAGIFAAFGDHSAYLWIFVASLGGRAAALPLLSRVSPGAAPLSQIFFRTLAVRPSGVAVQRPILGSIGPPASGTPPRADGSESSDPAVKRAAAGSSGSKDRGSPGHGSPDRAASGRGGPSGASGGGGERAR